MRGVDGGGGSYPGEGGNPPSGGRGRGMVLPAWMTSRQQTPQVGGPVSYPPCNRRRNDSACLVTAGPATQLCAAKRIMKERLCALEMFRCDQVRCRLVGSRWLHPGLRRGLLSFVPVIPFAWEGVQKRWADKDSALNVVAT